MKKNIGSALLICCILMIVLFFTGCEFDENSTGSKTDVERTISVANNLQTHQATPTDISYSLERYNLIRREYWVNGQREKANTLPCEIVKPLGYIVLFSGNTIVGNFVVDGKVSSLNSFLTPDSEYYELVGGEHAPTQCNNKYPDIDGNYMKN